MTAQNATLEAAILAHPEDARAWSIYGDWLEAEGDPRGEWIGLMLAREASPTPRLARAERAFFEANKGWLLGPELVKSSAALVWRRGFLAGAKVETTDGLREVLEHPSARFLDQVTLAPVSDAVADAWSPLIAGARWKSVRVKNARNAEAVLALPRLSEAVITVPYWEPQVLDASKATKLERLTVESAAAELLAHLLGRLPPSLRELRLTGFRDNAVEVLAAHPPVVKLALLSVDSETTPEDLDALAAETRPSRLVLRQPPEGAPLRVDEFPGVSSIIREERLETAFLVLDSPQLGREERATLVRLAQACRCRQLVAFIAPVRFAGRTITVCRLHSDDNTAALIPSVLAHVLSQPKRVRAAAFTFSESNDLARGLVFGGPPVESSAGKRARQRMELAAAHKTEASHLDRSQVVREAIDHLVGIDPGPELVDTLLCALDETTAVALHGERSPLPPLLTEEPASPVPDEDEESEEEEEDEGWDDEEEFGAEDPPPPEEERPEEPSKIDRPLALQVAAAEAEEEAEDDDEEEEEEVDEDAEPDAVDASAEEIWNEGPVDPDPEWAEEPIEDPLLDEPAEPDRVVPDEIEATVVTLCVRCATPANLVPCGACRDELCERCLPIDEARPDLRPICAQCTARE